MAVAEPFLADLAHHSRWRHAAVSREACAQLTLGMVHEMNNLTGGISALSEIYLQSAESGLPLTEGLELIHKSTGRLQALVRHLQVVHGPLNEEPTYFNVAEAVRSLLDLLAPTLPKDVTVKTDFPAEEFAACLDEALFRQVLINLTLNLRDALAAHPVTERGLRLSLRRLSADKAELVLAPAGNRADDFHPRTPESDEKWATGQARLFDADQTLRELGGQLTCGPEGEYLLELPLIA